MNILRRIFLVLLGLTVGCAAHPVPGSIFRPQGANFTCVVPANILSDYQMTQRHDGETIFVSFQDDYGQLLRVESAPLPPNMQGQFSASRQQEVLDYIFDKLIMPLEFKKASSESSAVGHEFVDTTNGLALFRIVIIPNQVQDQEIDSHGNTTEKKLPLTRGVLIFTHKGYFYVVSNQKLLPPFKDNTSQLLIQLKKAVSQITFD